MISGDAVDPKMKEVVESLEKEDRKRRLLLLLLLILMAALCWVGYIFLRYLIKPQSLAAILVPPPIQLGCYSPAYKFSIDNVDGPVSVAVSPDNQRIYVAESRGERWIKMFDRDGNLILRFAPPGTDPANREPKYLAVDASGRIFVVDSTSNAIDIFNNDGELIDAIIDQELTLTKYLTSKIGDLPEGIKLLHYEGINRLLTYQLPGEAPQTVRVEFPADRRAWLPLGIRFDLEWNLLYSDISGGEHSIKIIPAADLQSSLSNFSPQIMSFGMEGRAKDQFYFPQVAVKDDQGNFYVSDGNNSRISIWTPDMQYRSFFGFGSEPGSLNLPRGMAINRNCLMIADAVGSVVRVYDVSGEEPQFALDIGAMGVQEGEFRYPIDIFLDGTGRLYIADRENDRIQVWSY